MTLGRALLASLRPRQWTKNALLLAPLVFAHRVTNPGSVRSALLAVVAFSLLASAVYLGNDLADRDRDRAHPVKRERPVAAGLLSPGWAGGAALLLGAASLLLAWALGAVFFAWCVGYLALQALYAGVLKQVAVVDVFAVAAGYVLRVVAGAAAIQVPVSNWLYLCTLLLALFLALEKRRAEILLLGAEAEHHRGILSAYSVGLLDQLSGIAAAAAVLAYSLYTLAPDTAQKFGSDRLKYTIPFVLFGIYRYLWLSHRAGEGGEPERVLLRDGPTQLNLVGWLATVAWAIYGRAG
ncbi:MAG TPA: decaprenyl-phosphate phosphoribosyltransferase [Anaeromyxobacteraceae bacterium]|nr:decaprenyl-phosphate phosphoribosyltransferase [Anaeromyxobacteraceae bacterium]